MSFSGSGSERSLGVRHALWCLVVLRGRGWFPTLCVQGVLAGDRWVRPSKGVERMKAGVGLVVVDWSVRSVVEGPAVE